LSLCNKLSVWSTILLIARAAPIAVSRAEFFLGRCETAHSGRVFVKADALPVDRRVNRSIMFMNAGQSARIDSGGGGYWVVAFGSSAPGQGVNAKPWRTRGRGKRYGWRLLC
jgi:hypothetical protein